MASKDDGGQAFPGESMRPVTYSQEELERAHDAGEHPSKYALMQSGGMSLRDWFAGQALAGICTRMPDDVYESLATDIIAGRPIAHVAYVLADAMIAERAR